MKTIKPSRWSDGRFRANVAVLLRLADGNFVSCLRSDVAAWQCVQGGLEDLDATPEQGVLRELSEELGLASAHVRIIYRSQVWRRYRFPSAVQKPDDYYVGQDQLWLLAEVAKIESIDLRQSNGEFSQVQPQPLAKLLAHYASWKKPLLVDFCRELSL